MVDMACAGDTRASTSRSNTNWIVVQTTMVLGVMMFLVMPMNKHKGGQSQQPGGKAIILAQDLLQLAERSASLQSE